MNLAMISGLGVSLTDFLLVCIITELLALIIAVTEVCKAVTAVCKAVVSIRR